MGLVQRIQLMLAANLNDLLDRAEQPLVMLKQHLRDLRDYRSNLRTVLIETLAAERHTQQQIDEKQAEAGKWQHKAVYSLGQNRDDLARRALANRVQTEDAISTLRSRQAQQQLEISRINELAFRLDERIADLEARIASLQVSAPPAGTAHPPTGSKLVETASGIATSLDRAEEYLRQIESGAARDETITDMYLDRLRSGSAADAELTQLEETNRVEDELQMLKARLRAGLDGD